MSKQVTNPIANIYTAIEGDGHPDQISTHGRAARSVRHRFSRWLNVLALVMLVALMGVTAVSLVWIDRMYAGRIYPNVVLQGVDLSHRTLPEAEQEVRRFFESFLQQPITLSYGDRTWQPGAAELGITYDLDQSLTDAYNAGRQSGLLANARYLIMQSQPWIDLPLRIDIDDDKLHTYLQDIAAEIEQPVREATLNIVGDEIQLTPSAEGRMLLVEETAQEITQSLKMHQPQVIALRTRTLEPHISTEEVAESRSTAENTLTGPVELVLGDQTFKKWPISRTC
jgi:hypothetical protein